MPGVRNTAAANATSARKVILPSECSHCQGSSIADPFQPTNTYCSEHYDTCKCCRAALENAKLQICTTGKQGGTFMGYGTCVAGIKAAITEKKRQCEHQQAVDDWHKDQTRREINDALGDKSPYNFVNVAAGHNSTGYVDHRFESECAAYSDPSCKSFKALCAFSYGCNDQLHKIEGDLDTVKDYYGMYQNIPCFSR